MLTALEEAKRRGARIVAVNPLPEAGLMRFKNPQTRQRRRRARAPRSPTSSCQIRIDGDLALFQAVGHLLLDRGRAAPGTVLDQDFVEQLHRTASTSTPTHWRDLDWADRRAGDAA